MKNIMLLIMTISLSNFVAGSIMGPSNDLEKAKGFVGYSSIHRIYENSSAMITTFLNWQWIC